MTDIHTVEQRHRNMSAIKGRDTKPELIVRKRLWSEGYRYRLYVKSLPGKPDIVIRKYKIAIFINGCFWHGHNIVNKIDNYYTIENSDCCKIPKTRTDFWLKKIMNNIQRDFLNYNRLHQDGWTVLEVWECQLKGKDRQEQTLRALICKISSLVLEYYRLQKLKPYKIENEDPIASVAEEHNQYQKNIKNEDIFSK